MSFPETVSISLCINSSVVQTHSFISCPGGRSQTIPQDVEVLGWRGDTWSVVGRTAKFSKTTLEVAYGREMNIKFSGNSSGGHSCSHANCTLPKNLRHLWHGVVTELHILKWPFFAPSTRCTCVMRMRFNQLLNMPHLSGRWIILAMDKCSLTGM